jgi:hypothetical protein
MAAHEMFGDSEPAPDDGHSQPCLACRGLATVTERRAAEWTLEAESARERVAEMLIRVGDRIDAAERTWPEWLPERLSSKGQQPPDGQRP